MGKKNPTIYFNMECYNGIKEINMYASKYTYVFRRPQQQRHYFVLKKRKNKIHGSSTTTVCLVFSAE